MPMTARCASATNPVEPGTASVIPPTKTQAVVPDETLAHAELSALGLGMAQEHAEAVAEPWTRYVGRRTRHHEARIRPDLPMCDS